MVWFRVDDNLAFHPKVMQAGNSAMGLWVRAGSWCAQQLNDGVVPREIVTALGGNDLVADDLVAAGLWHEHPKGYEFHEWEGRQPTRAEVEADREAARERQRQSRERRSDVTRDSRVSHDAPTRPDPTQSSKELSLGADAPTTKTKRGTRLPDDFAVSDEMRAWARENTPDVNESEHAKFCDYWRAQPGAKGVKLDWVATWRNWMRRAQDDRASSRGNRYRSQAERNADVLAKYV